MTLEDLKYPIGKYEKPDQITEQQLKLYIADIQDFPAKLETAVGLLTDEQLNTPYRPQGWTIRQVVHHCADSHMNSLIRFKLALTEDKPVIKPYFEDRWAELTDSQNYPIEPSLVLLKSLHARWTHLLVGLNESQFERKFIHPEHGKEFSLKENTGIYAWHGKHHLAQIISLVKRMNW